MKPMAWVRRARGSVRLRVTLLAAGAFAIVLGVAAFVLLRSLEGALKDDVRSTSEALLRRQAALVTSRGIPRDAQPVTLPDGRGFQVQVADPGGAPDNILIMQGVEGSTPIASAEAFGIEGPVSDYTFSSVRAPGGFVLATAASLQEVRETIDTTRTMFWIVGPSLVALVAVLAWLLAGRALRPVHAVTSRVAAIGSHSLHERVPVPPSHDEIAELATTMNDMLVRLEVSSATSRRLVSDASHELRTPVTVMRTELEVAGRDLNTNWEETSTVLLGELDRLQGMVDDLLLLARGDERAFAREPVDVTDLVHDVAARRWRVPVSVELAEEPATTTGDEEALRRSLDHLVANGARHADTKVVIAIEVHDGVVSVHVDDDGRGIPVADRERAVRRFVRSDEGRARDNGGAGLGLAVTSDVATAHGGRLVIGDSPLGGARVSLSLPRLTP